MSTVLPSLAGGGSGSIAESSASRQWHLLREYQRAYRQRLETEDEAALAAAAEAADLTWREGAEDDNYVDDGSDDEDDVHLLSHETSRAALSPSSSNIHPPQGGEGAEEVPNTQSTTAEAAPQQMTTLLPKFAARSRRLELRESLLTRTIPLRFMLEYLQTCRSATRVTVDLLLFLPLLFLSLNLFLLRSADLMDEGAYWTAALKTNLVDAPVTPQGFHAGDTPLSVPGPHHLLNFMSVRTSEEWGLWLQRVAVPLFFDPLQRTRSPSRPGPSVGQTVLASAIRLRTLRMRSGTCTVPSYLVSTAARSTFGDVPCYAAMSDDAIDSAAVAIDTTLSSGMGGGVESLIFEPLDECGGYSATLLKTRAEYRGNSYGCGGYVFYLNGSLSFTDALDLTDAWLASNVLNDAASRFVSLEVVLYHTALDSYALVELSHEITEGGAWHPYPRLTWFQVFSTTHSYPTRERVADGFLAFFLIVGWALFFGEWMLSFRDNRRSLGAYFMDPWTVVNATYLTCVSVSVIMTWVQADAGASALKANGPSSRPPTFQSVFWYHWVYLARLYHWTRYFDGVASVMLLLKVIEYFRLNSRLNILTRTLGRVAESIIGVVVLFCLFVVAFALCGHILYGTRLFSYSTMALAFATSMLSLMGTFEYAALREQDRHLTFVYFWSFVVLGLFVLLNFITAVISTAFDEERTRLRLTPMRIVFQRLRQQLSSVRPLREKFHLYVRCVKAFHSISPNVLWNRMCQHVETAIALDEVLRHEQNVQHRAEMLRRNSSTVRGGGGGGPPTTLGGGPTTGSNTFSDLQIAQHNRNELLDQLVGLNFFVGAIGKEDLAVISLPQIENIFLGMLRAHDRLRPLNAVSDHWMHLDLVEAVVLDRVKGFLTSTVIAGRVGRKAQRLMGTSKPQSSGGTTDNNTTGGTQPDELVRAALHHQQDGGGVNRTGWVHRTLIPYLNEAGHQQQQHANATQKASSLASRTPVAFSLGSLHERIENVAKVLSALQQH